MLPYKFIFFHNGEEQLRSESVRIIESNESLLLNMSIIEHAMNISDVLQHVDIEDEDYKLIQILGIRIFNAFASSIKLVLSGYYQNGALIMRDVLETVFLIDFFSTNREAVSRWRNADKKEIMKSFRPIHIREALDKRDGFTNKKRAAAYELFSELAGHASMRSVTMLKPEGLDSAWIGPFVEESSLEASLTEIGRLAMQAGEILAIFFPPDYSAGSLAREEFFKVRNQWMKRYYPSAAAKFNKFQQS